MITPEMLNYVRQQMTLGMTKEMIKNDLLGRGWPEIEIDQALAQAANSPQPIAAPISISSQKQPASDFSVPASSSRVLSWLTGIAVAIVLLSGGWYAYSRFFNKPNGVNTALTTNQSKANGPDSLLNPSIFVGAYDDYKIYVPKDWQLKAGNTAETEREIFYEPGSQILSWEEQIEQNKPLCALEVSRASAHGFNFDKMVFNDRNGYEQLSLSKKLEELKESDITANNIPYHIFEGTMLPANKQIAFRQQETVINDINFSVSYYCDADRLANNKEALNASVNTFTILPDKVSAAPAAVTAQVDSRLESTAYVDTSYGYRINLPREWVVMQLPDDGGFAAYPKNAPIVGGSPYPFLAVLNSPAGNKSLESILNFLLENDPTHKSLISKKTLKISGYDALNYEVTGLFEGQNVRMVSTMVITKNQLYSVQGTALEPTWKDNKDIFEASLATFKVD